MGFAKQRELEQSELGFYADEMKAVCQACVDDPFLKEFIRDNGFDATCDFCGKEGTVAGTDDVLAEIAEAVGRYWRTAGQEGITPGPDDEMGQSALMDISDVLSNEDALPLGNPQFEEFVLRAFSQTQWCRPDPFVVTKDEALAYSWEHFSEVVMHENRYFFTPQVAGDRGPDLIHEGIEMLRQIGQLINKYELVSELGMDIDLHRIRVHPQDVEYTTAPELGTPPRDSARQSRMSPAGIEMFYVASDRDTALAETLTPQDLGRVASAATFRLREAIFVVDFSDLPEYPGLFDSAADVDERPTIGFLHRFRGDLSKSIQRDDRIHIEYVPTQVVCEYIRTRFKGEVGEISGLAFGSARKPGVQNWALFINHDHCLDPGAQPFFKHLPIAELTNVERIDVVAELLDRLGIGSKDDT